MAGLVPAIHVLILLEKDVDARDISAFTRVFRRAMRGHDVGESDSTASTHAVDTVGCGNILYRTNSRIALSRPSSVSGYIRPPMSWRMMRIDWV